MSTIQLSIQLITVHCGVCGGTYAINERYHQKKREECGHWHCPYCECSWGFSGKTKAQIEQEKREMVERQLEQARAESARMRDERDTAENRRRAEKAAKTRIKNRVANGVCPCCNRSFQNLHRHMTTKHPEFAGDQA